MEVETCYVVLWSPSQRAVHAEAAAEMAAINRRTFLDEELNDFVVLEFAADYASAKERGLFYENRRNAQDDVRKR